MLGLAQMMHDEFVGPEHIFLSLLETPGTVKEVMAGDSELIVTK